MEQPVTGKRCVADSAGHTSCISIVPTPYKVDKYVRIIRLCVISAMCNFKSFKPNRNLIIDDVNTIKALIVIIFATIVSRQSKVSSS